MATVEERLTAVEASIAGLLNRETNNNGRLDSIEGNNGVFAARVDSAGIGINDLQSQIGDINTQLSSLFANDADHESRITALENPTP